MAYLHKTDRCRGQCEQADTVPPSRMFCHDILASKMKSSGTRLVRDARKYSG
jgi:hypothetical protein